MLLCLNLRHVLWRIIINPAVVQKQAFFPREVSITRQEELRCPLPMDGFFRAAPAARFPFARPWMLGGGLCLVSPFWLSRRGKPTAQPRRPCLPGAGSRALRNALDAPQSRGHKTFEIRSNLWEIPTMTVVTDNKKRVTLRLAKPGDRFDVQLVSDGNYILTKLEPVQHKGPAKVRIEKRGPYHVGVLDQPINEEALKDALAEFP
jgi:hypothetical protein